MPIIISINKINMIIHRIDFEAAECTSLLKVKNTYHNKIKTKKKNKNCAMFMALP